VRVIDRGRFGGLEPPPLEIRAEQLLRAARFLAPRHEPIAILRESLLCLKLKTGRVALHGRELVGRPGGGEPGPRDRQQTDARLGLGDEMVELGAVGVRWRVRG
jgi:hypothetical protein